MKFFFTLSIFLLSISAQAFHSPSCHIAVCDSVVPDFVCSDSLADDSLIAETDTLPWAEDLRLRLDRLAEEAMDAYYTTGICVYDLTGDSLLFEYNQKKVMRPASTQKLLTAISALSVLGGNHQYKTQAFYTGKVSEDSVLHGDIYVVGDFDPAFSARDLRSLATAIKDLGVRRIDGKVYGDVSMKDTLVLGNGWCWDDVPSEVEPYLSPLIFDRGCATVEVVKGEASFVVPTTYLKLTRDFSKGNLKLTRDWMDNGNTFVLSGSRPSGNRTISVWRPELYFLCTLCDMLREDSVETGGYGLARLPGSVSECLFVCTRSVEQILQRMMKDSDNLYAESMFYQLAAVNGGEWLSWKDGARQVENVIRKAGESTAYVEVADGSGVSLYNYVSPKVEVAMLRYAYANEQIYKYLLPSLPVAGVDGTLASRMKSGNACANVRAKTGTVSGVSCLAGYCEARNGNMLAFSIMNNGLMKAATGREFQDRVCQELTR